VITAGDIYTDTGVINRLHLIDPRPEFAFESLRSDVCVAGDQVAGKQHEIDTLIQYFVYKLAQNYRLDTIVRTAGIAGYDKLPRFLCKAGCREDYQKIEYRVEYPAVEGGKN
jgi:hypothetical protein